MTPFDTVLGESGGADNNPLDALKGAIIYDIGYSFAWGIHHRQVYIAGDISRCGVGLHASDFLLTGVYHIQPVFGEALLYEAA
jgi:hypothetical protein